MKTKYHSYKLGDLPKGCQLCVKGSKEVIFITGLCPRSCFYCPISDKKYKKDVIYADEWKTKNIRQIIKEAESISAEGAGITGGDPLCRLSRTISSIRALKKRFGKRFHIHLYSSLDLVNEKTLKKLHKSGLDEIRFHLDLNDKKLWHKLNLALNYSWDVGVEIPVIPGYYDKLKKITEFIDKTKKDSRKNIFLNLNELEIADNKVNKLLEKGFKPKNDLSYAVKGSEELAKKILKYIQKNKLTIDTHYCTATLKDKVQLANRIKRRANNIKKPYDTITKEGTLIRGAIYLEDLKPGIGYRKKLEKFSGNKKLKNTYLKKIRIIKDNMKKDFKIKNIDIDNDKLRILMSVKDINKIKDIIDKNLLGDILADKKLLKEKELYLAVVEEYPTHDQLEIEVSFL